MFPRLFHIGNFNMPTYGLLVSVGVLLGLWISVRNSQKQGIDPDNAWNLGIIVVMCGIIGAKVLYIIVDWSEYAAHPGEIFSLNTLQAGGVFSGGLIGAFAAAAWYIRRHRMPALATCDAFAPGLALGHAIGRVGCFAAGCCFGKPTDHFWGVTFTSPIAHEVVGTPIGEALQPTQLFESAVELVNFFILAWMLKRKKFDGQVIGTYFFLYGIARFLLEYLRGDPGRGEVFGGIITGTQLVALCLIAAGGLIWWLRPGMKQVPVPATR
jgi:phosphatidylglycerol---prolipoprotein diacylglyceryl transferase